MALKFISAVDMQTFLEAIRTDQGIEEFTVQLQGFALDGCYLHQLDKVVVGAKSSASNNRRVGFNPLLVGTGFPDAFYQPVDSDLPFGAQQIPVWAGDPNRPGGQRLYATESSLFGSAEIELVDPLTSLRNVATGHFVTTPAGNGPIRVLQGRGAGIPPGVGTWINGPQAGTGFGIGYLFFEGLTDGIPGETNQVGTNVYPQGLALTIPRTATIPVPIGTGAASDGDNALCWLNLDSGLMDGRMATTPGLATSDTAEPNSESPIAGQTFMWFVAQYMPDVDAMFAAPKGELLIVSNDNAIPADPVNFPQSVFVKIIDFNPFGVVATSGAPQRVHERVRLRSTVDFDDNPIFDVAGAADANDAGGLRLNFHPPSKRFFMMLAPQSATVPKVAKEAFMGYWLRQVDPSVLTTPVARDVPRTNDITQFECFVTGTLSEPAAGIGVNWSLFRNSSEGEIIDASTFPGTSTVANFPIDQSFPAQNEGTLVVVADAATLVEGVDYTVVLATGVITWITDQSGATLVTASYEHRETNAGDGVTAHGKLLTLSSLSQEDGRAFTQVRYADDSSLVGTLDRLINAFV